MESVQTGLENVVLAAYACPVGGLRDRPPLCNEKKTGQGQAAGVSAAARSGHPGRGPRRRKRYFAQSER